VTQHPGLIADRPLLVILEFQENNPRFPWAQHIIYAEIRLYKGARSEGRTTSGKTPLVREAYLLSQIVKHEIDRPGNGYTAGVRDPDSLNIKLGRVFKDNGMSTDTEMVGEVLGTGSVWF
jgi:hypothetical protein